MPPQVQVTTASDPRPAALWRGTVAHLVSDPFRDGAAALAIFKDGGLLLDQHGRVMACGPFGAVKKDAGAAPVHDRRGSWILPGFVDCHVHFPQTFLVATPGNALLQWLDQAVFPAEIALSDALVAAGMARSFCENLLRAGTTTALAFGSHDARATAFLFGEARRRGLRLITGKVLHGRDVPSAMIDRPAEALDQCRALIADWHGRGKLGYAVTPRFGLTSTPETFDICRTLLSERRDLWVQSHVSENQDEVAQTRARFPAAAHYCDVYEQAGILGPKTVLAHAIHLGDDERALLATRDVAVAHCPSSNLFLGSGLMPLRQTRAHGIRIGLGTDVGAGTSFSLGGECDQAYKVSALLGAPLSPAEILYLATLGGAGALGLDREIGNFAPGKAGDAVILDPSRDPYLKDLLAQARSGPEALFALLVLGRQSIVREVLLDGAAAWAET